MMNVLKKQRMLRRCYTTSSSITLLSRHRSVRNSSSSLLMIPTVGSNTTMIMSETSLSTSHMTQCMSRLFSSTSSSSSSSSSSVSSTTTTMNDTLNTSNTSTSNTSTNSSNIQHKYSKLFTPLYLGDKIDITLPNRVLMGSMHTGLEHHSIPSLVRYLFILSDSRTKNKKEPLYEMSKYIEQRVLGGVGLIVTGGIAPNYNGWTSMFSSQLTNEREMEYHKIITNTVHSIQVPIVEQSTATNDNNNNKNNNPNQLKSVPGRICLQILHTGRYGYHPLIVSASTTKSPISPFTAQALSVGMIQITITDFVNTALFAKQAGYDGIEIMGSEGYLLSQFLSPCTNHRTDIYGGPSIENRSRIVIEIIQQIRTAIGYNQFMIIFRLSLLDLVENGLSFQEAIILAQMIEDAGATIINTGIGWHESRIPTIATCVPRGAYTFTTKALKEQNVVSIPLITTNRINHPQTIENILKSNSADMVSMARPFLADPYIIQKARDGQEDEINTCIGCNQACLDHVFVGKVASCLVNPFACHETEMIIQELPIEQRLKIGVVGAGPAGCAFAVTAAQQGHNVTLYDKDTMIGGQFNMAKRIPGKEEFHETIRYYTTMLQKYNVNVQLQTEITYDKMIQEQQYDKWIIATGVVPRDPKIPGQDHPNVMSYIDVLKYKKPIGKHIAVIGAGGIGFDVSEYILHYTGKDLLASDVTPEQFWKDWGIDTKLEQRGGIIKMDNNDSHNNNNNNPNSDKKIYLLQRKKGKLGAGLGKTTGWIHRATLNKSGRVDMLNNVKYERIDENGHLHILHNDVPRILEVDNIIICAGQVEYCDLATAATANADDSMTDTTKLLNNIYTIGGAYAAGELDAKRAIDMGTRLALKIHEPDVVPGKHVFKAQVGVEEKMYSVVQRFMK